MTIRRISLCAAVAAWMLAGTVARAGSVTVPNTFTSGTIAQASQVNGNFSAVATAVNDNDGRISALEANGSVTSAKIADGTITFSDWSQNGCTTNQIAKWNGTGWACAADAGNTGTVTSVATGSGLTGGPITASGTVSIAAGGVTSVMIADGAVTFADWNQNGCTANQIAKWNGTAWACAADASNSGTVTSVATGSGLTGGPITSSGTIGIAAGGVTSAMIADGAVTSTKIAAGAVGASQIAVGAVTSANAILGYQTREARLAGGIVFNPLGSYNPYCITTTAYRPATNQVAFVDASLSWYSSGTTVGSANVIYSANGGGTWNTTFSGNIGVWTTSTGGWTSSTKTDVVSLTANTDYLFAVAGLSGYSTAFTSADGVCTLRVVFAAR